MKYFLHDSNAFSDEKITLLYLKFGFEAIGLFFCILEKLALQEQPVNEIVLKSQLNIKKRLEKQLTFMYKIGILSLRNGDVFSENILKFSEKYQIKKEKTRKRVSEWRDNQDNTNNVTSYKRVRNTPKDKISKDKIIKEKEDKEKVCVFNFKKELLTLGVKPHVADLWIKVRSKKNATNSDIALNAIKKQITLSGKSANECIKIAVENSWSGFKAEWLSTPINGKQEIKPPKLPEIIIKHGMDG